MMTATRAVDRTLDAMPSGSFNYEGEAVAAGPWPRTPAPAETKAPKAAAKGKLLSPAPAASHLGAAAPDDDTGQAERALCLLRSTSIASTASTASELSVHPCFGELVSDEEKPTTPRNRIEQPLRLQLETFPVPRGLPSPCSTRQRWADMPVDDEAGPFDHTRVCDFGENWDNQDIGCKDRFLWADAPVCEDEEEEEDDQGEKYRQAAMELEDAHACTIVLSDPAAPAAATQTSRQIGRSEEHGAITMQQASEETSSLEVAPAKTKQRRPGRGKGPSWQAVQTSSSSSNSALQTQQTSEARGACRRDKPVEKNRAKGMGKGVRHAHPPEAHLDAQSRGKRQSQFTIGIDEEPKFPVVRKVLGVAGANVKRIANETGVKLRLRGRGSKFLEGPEQKESSDPLMLCVSAPDPRAHEAAVDRVKALLRRVYREYDEHRRSRGLESAGLNVRMHEGAREGARPARLERPATRRSAKVDAFRARGASNHQRFSSDTIL